MKLVEFLSSKNNDRVFVFQSLYTLSQKDIHHIQDYFYNIFFPDWHSHQNKIHPEFVILNNHFIVISTCTSKISGCAIDSLTRQIKHIERELNINLLNRMQVPFFSSFKKDIVMRDINNLSINFLSYNDFIKEYSDKKKENIFVFNINITYSDDLWISPLSIWQKNYLIK